MKRAVLLNCAALVFLSCATLGQATGQLVITVKAASEANLAAAPANGVKVIIVHWTNTGCIPHLRKTRSRRQINWDAARYNCHEEPMTFLSQRTGYRHRHSAV
jgi:hypothetical protein